jgi:hypothetical protein
MRSAAELAALRAGTKGFIAANPTVLTLIPRKRVTSGTGTVFQDLEPRTPQSLRLLDQSTARSPQPGIVQTSDGRERLTDFILLAEHNAVVALWDYWKDGSGVWEVAQIFPPNGYEIRAAVVKHA